MTQQPAHTPLSKIFSWFQKGAWTVVDQGLFAGSNFILYVLLARWLTPAQYGAFAVAFTVFLLVGTAHTGILTEPMLVFGPVRYEKNLPAYLAILLRGHLIFSLIAAIILLGTAVWFRHSAGLGAVFLALAFSQAFMLFLWLMRRAYYIKLQPLWAAIVGAVYALLMLAGDYVAFRQSWLSATTALAIMSVASVAAGLWAMAQLDIRLFAKSDPSLRRDVITQHKSYAPWAVATGALMWIPSQLPLLVLSATAGLEASAALKALRNLAMPAAQAYTGLLALLVPAFVNARNRGGLTRALWVSAGIMIACMGLYWVFLGFAGAPLMRWMYKGQYCQYTGLLWALGAQPVVAAVAAVLGAGLRAQERPDQVFWSYLGTSIGIVTIGIAMIYWWSVMGAVWGYVVCNLIGIGVMLYLLSKPSAAQGGTRPVAETPEL
jgi:O-antigen/teichoic acid export membrane protein